MTFNEKIDNRALNTLAEYDHNSLDNRKRIKTDLPFKTLL